MTWSERFKYCLEHIKSEFILFMIEDYFIQEPINIDIVERAHKLMKSNNKIGMSLVMGTDKTDVDAGTFDDEYFFARKMDKSFYVTCEPAIWRREYLIKILRSHETVWEFEKFAIRRMLKYDKFVIQQRNNTKSAMKFGVRVEDGYGITMKKWLPKNKGLFEKYGIDVNYDNLGWLDTERHNDNSKSDKKPEEKSLREYLYRIKTKPRRLKKHIIKAYRKFLSII